MSRTYSLVCEETKQKLWIGQGRMNEPFYLYHGKKDVMKKLSLFLNETRGKPLVLLDDEIIDYDIVEFMDDDAN